MATLSSVARNRPIVTAARPVVQDARMTARIVHLLSSCPTVGELSDGIAVHRHARALARAGHAVWLAIVPYWLTQAGRFPRPRAETRAAANHPSLRSVDEVPICVFDRLDAVAAELLTFVRSVRADVLHYHHSHYTELAHFIAAELDIPVVYTAHLPFGDPVTTKYKGVVDDEVAAAIRRADRFTVLVESGVHRIERWLPDAVAHTRVVGHGVEDREHIRTIAAARTRRSPVTASFIGRFVPEKGIDDLVAAIPAALAACPALRFVLIGHREGFGHRSPATLRAQLGEQASERVRFEPWMDRPGIERELEQADLLVAPSLFESFGLAIAEAMLFGLPIVATDSEGPRALIGPAECGRLVAPGDPAGLAAAIVELASDADLRLAMGRRAAAHARAQLSWEPVIAAMLSVYAELG